MPLRLAQHSEACSAHHPFPGLVQLPVDPRQVGAFLLDSSSRADGAVRVEGPPSPFTDPLVLLRGVFQGWDWRNPATPIHPPTSPGGHSMGLGAGVGLAAAGTSQGSPLPTSALTEADSLLKCKRFSLLQRGPDSQSLLKAPKLRPGMLLLFYYLGRTPS